MDHNPPSSETSLHCICMSSWACGGPRRTEHCCLCRPAESVCFYNIMERAQQRGRIAIGVKQLREKAPDLNPKAKGDACLSLSSTESIVTLAVGAT